MRGRVYCCACRCKGFVPQAVVEALYLKQLLPEFGYETSCIELACDNQGTIKVIYGQEGHSARMKHVDVRVHLLKDHVAKQDLSFFYIPSEDNVADFFTKVIPYAKLCELRDKMGVI
eukprot:366143-Chlamydomonas_euryale.AAC.3